MKNRFIYIVFLLAISSCSKKVYNINYRSEGNYSSFYVVDTIKIIDPVRIHSPKFGGQFIVSKSILRYYNDKVEFFNRPDVFILGDDLYRDLPQKDYKKYTYPENGGCKFVRSPLVISGIEVYEFSGDSVSFVLGLINANYFYVNHNSYASFLYAGKNDEKSFYKIVYPLCN